MENIKVSSDGFVWLIITDKAIKVWQSNLFEEMDILYTDDTETEIQTLIELTEAINAGLDIGIPVGPITKEA